jgi:hypothetical protein
LHVDRQIVKQAFVALRIAGMVERRHDKSRVSQLLGRIVVHNK